MRVLYGRTILLLDTMSNKEKNHNAGCKIPSYVLLIRETPEGPKIMEVIAIPIGYLPELDRETNIAKDITHFGFMT